MAMINCTLEVGPFDPGGDLSLILFNSAKKRTGCLYMLDICTTYLTLVAPLMLHAQ